MGGFEIWSQYWEMVIAERSMHLTETEEEIWFLASFYEGIDAN